MAKYNKDTTKYQSLYSPGEYITAAKYIAEKVCEKRAAFLGKNLPVKFWNLDEWKKFFKYQLFLAYPLIKKYGEKAIIRALDDHGAKTAWSLKNPRLVPLFKQYAEQIKQENIEKASIPEPNPVIQHNNKTRPRRESKTGILGKLKELDEG